MSHLKLLLDINELSLAVSQAESIAASLDKVVAIVAKYMAADICSFFIYDEEKEELVLKASEGLDKNLINKLKFKRGEGLAGTCIEDLKIIRTQDALSDPKFKFIGNSSEETHKSFLVVPVFRGINRIGVLVLQRKDKIHFKKLDERTMLTVAAQLVNLLEDAKLILSVHKKHSIDSKTKTVPYRMIKGKSNKQGTAYSGAIVYEQSNIMNKLAALSPEKQYKLQDLENSLKLAEQQLIEIQKKIQDKLIDVAVQIFSAHIMILKDKAFIREIKDKIKEGINAPTAVIEVANRYIELFKISGNPYIREKTSDISDITLRILSNLLHDETDKFELKGKIIVASELYPSDILKLYFEKVTGIIVTSGGSTSHVAILARSLNIPFIIVDDPSLLELPTDTTLLLDAVAGNLYVNPPDEVYEPFVLQKQTELSKKGKVSAMQDITLTKDDKRIRLLVNINLISDTKIIKNLNYDGVGLYRTEFPFIVRNNFPTEEEQLRVYQEFMKNTRGKEVTFRTLDVGGDKVLSYFQQPSEKNPFLGMRSIRFSLSNVEIFKQQINAILRAGKNSVIRIMFPMISSIEEFSSSKNIVYECIEDLSRRNIAHNSSPKVGMMVEIPSVINTIEDYTDEADFFSIGTNDLVQYTLAIDRTNEKVAKYYIPHHPSILRSLFYVTEIANRNSVDISVCGDMANNKKYIPLLLGMGIRTLSVDPIFLPETQKAIRSIDLSEATALAKKIRSLKKIAEIESCLGINHQGLS